MDFVMLKNGSVERREAVIASLTSLRKCTDEELSELVLIMHNPQHSIFPELRSALQGKGIMFKNGVIPRVTRNVADSSFNFQKGKLYMEHPIEGA